MDDIEFDFEGELAAKDAQKRATLKKDGSVANESSGTRGRHGIVCRHWLRDLCMKGDKCDFLHQFDESRMPECLFWLKNGKCQDPHCLFRHVAASERPECQRYRMGFCKYGPLCRSRHDRLLRESLPEVWPDWFLDSLIVNWKLIPRAKDIGLKEPTLGKGSGRGGQDNQQLALVPLAPMAEQGTIPGLPPPIHGKCRYFIMRSMNTRNIQISAWKGIWATSASNISRVRQAFNEVDHIILILAATGPDGKNFHGYAKMLTEPDKELFPGIWGDMPCRLSANFRVHWIKQCNTASGSTRHIKNPHNEESPVSQCRDGHELPSSVGELLCRFLWQQAHVDLLKGTDLEFTPRVNYDAYSAVAVRDTRQSQGDVPLALEDKKESSAVDVDSSRARPAPEKIGSFDKAVPSGSYHVRTGGKGGLTVGRSSASGAAMTEDAYRNSRLPPGAWPAPPPGWRSHPYDVRLAPGYHPYMPPTRHAPPPPPHYYYAHYWPPPNVR